MGLNESIQKNISWGLVCRLKYVLADEPRFKNVYSIIGATSVARYFNRPLLFHRPCTEINPSTVVKKLCRYPLPRNVLAGALGACRFTSLRFLAKRFCSLMVALFGRITRSFYFFRGFIRFKAVKIHKKREFVRLLEFFRLALDSRGIRLFFRAIISPTDRVIYEGSFREERSLGLNNAGKIGRNYDQRRPTAGRTRLHLASRPI